MAYWRRELAREAMLKSIDVRRAAGLDLNAPLCIYSLCADMKVQVRFVSFSMEGTYVRAERPAILLSALRPQPRRVFTCGHELGHHVFGHGTTIDEVIEETKEGSATNPNEFLVNTFSGFLLMPTLGIRRAFVKRSWQVGEATPLQIFTVACSFGVGYETLVSHLYYALQMIPRSRLQTLLKSNPKAIRAGLLGQIPSESLIVADAHWELPTVDAEVGSHLLLPHRAEAASGLIDVEGDFPCGRLFRVARPGIVQVTCPGTEWAVFVRASRSQFVGLSQYRHLEDNEDE